MVDPNLEKARIWLEGQSRWDDNFSHWYQGMARAAVGYSLTDRATIWAGYTYSKRWLALCSSARCVARIPLCFADQYRNCHLQDHDRKQFLTGQ